MRWIRHAGTPPARAAAPWLVQQMAVTHALQCGMHTYFFAVNHGPADARVHHAIAMTPTELAADGFAPVTSRLTTHSIWYGIATGAVPVLFEAACIGTGITSALAACAPDMRVRVPRVDPYTNAHGRPGWRIVAPTAELATPAPCSYHVDLGEHMAGNSRPHAVLHPMLRDFTVSVAATDAVADAQAAPYSHRFGSHLDTAAFYTSPHPLRGYVATWAGKCTDPYCRVWLLTRTPCRGWARMGAQSIARASVYPAGPIACSPRHAAAQYHVLAALATAEVPPGHGIFGCVGHSARAVLAEVQACTITMAFVYSCTSAWNAKNHRQHARTVQVRVRTTMFCAKRRHWDAPLEIWEAIFNGGDALL